MFNGGLHAIDIVIVIASQLGSHIQAILQDDQVIWAKFIKATHHLGWHGTYIQSRSTSHGEIIEGNTRIAIHCHTIEQGTAISLLHGESNTAHLFIYLGNLQFITLKNFAKHLLVIHCRGNSGFIVRSEKEGGMIESVNMGIVSFLSTETDAGLSICLEIVVGDVLKGTVEIDAIHDGVTGPPFSYLASGHPETRRDGGDR